MSSSPSKLKEDRRNEKVLMSFIFPNGSCYLRVRDLKSASKCDRSRVRGSGMPAPQLWQVLPALPPNLHAPESGDRKRFLNRIEL